MRVGWLGLGAMGAPMAGCLARAGHAVTAYDIVPGRAAALAADGVAAADSITAAVRDAELAAIMVATPDQVDEVLFGPGGAAGALTAGTVVVIMATVGPEVVAEVAGRLGGQGVTVVDAPVSGGVQRAAAGDLLIMVSGTDDAVGRARPLLGALARSAPVVGPAPGDGQRMKLVNQLLCGVHIAAAAEALAFAESLGLDPGDCWRVLRDGAAASFMFEDRGGADGRRAVRAAAQRPGHLRQGHGPGQRGGAAGGRVRAAHRGRPAAVPGGPRTGAGPARRRGADRGRPPGPAFRGLAPGQRRNHPAG